MVLYFLIYIDISKCEVKPYHFSDGGSDSCFVMFDRETTGTC